MTKCRVWLALLLSLLVIGLPVGIANLAMGGALPLASRTTVPRLHVVLLGVSEYRSRHLHKLEAATKDAVLLGNAFRELGGRADLLSYTALYEPTREQIITTLSDVAKQAKTSGEPVVVYWAGHSHYDEKGDRLYLFPVDGDAVEGGQSDAPAFKNAIEFAEDFLPLFSTETRLLFLGDGCNIGEGLVGQVAKKYPNLVVFSSSKVDEQVMDVVPALKHGALAYFLAQALREPIRDVDGDGLLSVDDLYMHVYPRVVEAVRKASLSFSQHPTVFGRYSHRIQLAAALAPLGESVAFRFADGVPAEIRAMSRLRFNGREVPIVVSTDAKSIEIPVDDSYRLPAGLNEISWGDEQKKFLVWKERRDLAKFEFPYKKSHAILIAIDDYTPADRPRTDSLRKLEGMVEQARKLAGVLRDLGFEEIVELYDKDATRQKIEDTLRSYWPQEKNEKVDRLFVYYGGHGLSARDANGVQQSLLATYDYDLARKATTTFHTNALKYDHSQNIAANHVLFALDVCHSGLVTSKLSRDDDAKLAENDSRLALVGNEVNQRARNFLVAGTKDQEAIYDPVKKGGIFTMKLIEALRGEADVDKDGLLTFTELHQWVKKSVIRLVQTEFRGQTQVPDYDKLVGKGDMLFFPGVNVRLIANSDSQAGSQQEEPRPLAVASPQELSR